MEEKRLIEWQYANHSIHPDKNTIYCRMANKAMKFDSEVCFNCPLWNGDCREVHCAYYGPMINEDVKPGAMKKLMDGVISTGFDTEFPSFVTQEYVNYAGRVTPNEWTVNEFARIEQAYQFAALAHKGQVRKGTRTPYIVHPVETSIIAYEISDDINVIISSILHDIVEDTDYTLYDIEAQFGSVIAHLVSYESEDKRKDLPPEESWKIRKREFLQHLTSAPVEAKVITLADKLSNMRAIARDFRHVGDNIWERFNQKDKKEHEWYYREISELTKEFAATERYREYVQLCDTVFAGSTQKGHGKM